MWLKSALFDINFEIHSYTWIYTHRIYALIVCRVWQIAVGHNLAAWSKNSRVLARNIAWGSPSWRSLKQCCKPDQPFIAFLLQNLKLSLSMVLQNFMHSFLFVLALVWNHAYITRSVTCYSENFNEILQKNECVLQFMCSLW